MLEKVNVYGFLILPKNIISAGLHICALDGSFIEQVSTYKYLDFWIGQYFKKQHTDELVKLIFKVEAYFIEIDHASS